MTLTLEALIRDVIIAEGGPSSRVDQEARERAARLTPVERAYILSDIAATLPCEKAPILSFGHSEEALALVLSLPRAWRGEAARYAQARLPGGLVFSAFGARDAAPMAPVVALPQRRAAEAGFVGPEVLVVCGILALLSVAAVALASGAAWIVALLAGVGVTALWLSPLLDLAPRGPARPALPVTPVKPPGGGRVRREMPLTVAPLRHRAPGQKGHMIGTTLMLSSGLILVGAALCALVARRLP